MEIFILLKSLKQVGFALKWCKRVFEEAVREAFNSLELFDAEFDTDVLGDLYDILSQLDLNADPADIQAVLEQLFAYWADLAIEGIKDTELYQEVQKILELLAAVYALWETLKEYPDLVLAITDSMTDYAAFLCQVS